MNLIGAHHQYNSSLPSIHHKSLTNADSSDYFITVSDQQSSSTLAGPNSKEYRQWLKLYKPSPQKDLATTNPILQQIDRSKFRVPQKSQSISLMRSGKDF